ncbi:MAG: hypothetical protein IH856_07775 [Deltaproteobacteria bacterium]|nr:hypothetical protein [Deltaproteobacteria bacterium]MCZ6622288.1 hypothetical protein [Deltaproteobacteria bacterium]
MKDHLAAQDPYRMEAIRTIWKFLECGLRHVFRMKDLTIADVERMAMGK